MTDWIAHDGTCCPVSVGTWVEVRRSDGAQAGVTVDEQSHTPISSDWRLVSRWFWDAVALGVMVGGKDLRIIAYRIPSARHVEAIKASIKNPVKEREPA